MARNLEFIEREEHEIGFSKHFSESVLPVLFTAEKYRLIVRSGRRMLLVPVLAIPLILFAIAYWVYGLFPGNSFWFVGAPFLAMFEALFYVFLMEADWKAAEQRHRDIANAVVRFYFDPKPTCGISDELLTKAGLLEGRQGRVTHIEFSGDYHGMDFAYAGVSLSDGTDGTDGQFEEFRGAVLFFKASLPWVNRLAEDLQNELDIGNWIQCRRIESGFLVIIDGWTLFDIPKWRQTAFDTSAVRQILRDANTVLKVVGSVANALSGATLPRGE